jgi:hypothetical protein
MTPRAPRKFTILDGMILVAATAGGFALWRAVGDTLGRHLGNVPFGAFSWFSSIVYRVVEAAFPLLAVLTPTVLIWRLRRPRPRWRRLMRQPGMAALCAALIPIATSLVGLRQIASLLANPASFVSGAGGEDFNTFGSTVTVSGPPLGDIYTTYGAGVGLWVLGAWLVLWLSGRRRPEKSWIDRLGRLVGIGWLMFLAASALMFVMS